MDTANDDVRLKLQSFSTSTTDGNYYVVTFPEQANYVHTVTIGEPWVRGIYVRKDNGKIVITQLTEEEIDRSIRKALIKAVEKGICEECSAIQLGTVNASLRLQFIGDFPRIVGKNFYTNWTRVTKRQRTLKKKNSLIVIGDTLKLLQVARRIPQIVEKLKNLKNINVIRLTEREAEIQLTLNKISVEEVKSRALRGNIGDYTLKYVPARVKNRYGKHAGFIKVYDKLWYRRKFQNLAASILYADEAVSLISFEDIPV